MKLNAETAENLARAFQFHKGTIETARRPSTRRVLYHFNSIKVRLKHLFRVCRLRTPDEFQFHKGTIETKQILITTALDNNFNSIKVRLKPYDIYNRNKKLPFQFHKGTIETRHQHKKYHVQIVFQFHKGTIETGG